ncbi:hypothetical protein GCM10010428_72250 [Actinosynnema pretiosum subsp. pretiosum]
MSGAANAVGDATAWAGTSATASRVVAASAVLVKGTGSSAGLGMAVTQRGGCASVGASDVRRGTFGAARLHRILLGAAWDQGFPRVPCGALFQLFLQCWLNVMGQSLP